MAEQLASTSLPSVLIILLYLINTEVYWLDSQFVSSLSHQCVGIIAKDSSYCSEQTKEIDNKSITLR